MSLIWGTILLVVLIETAAVAALLLPMPAQVRSMVGSTVHTITKNRHIVHTLRGLGVILGFCFFDALSSICSKDETGSRGSPAAHVTSVRAQRNAVLSGMAIALLVIFLRLVHLFGKYELVPRKEEEEGVNKEEKKEEKEEKEEKKEN